MAGGTLALVAAGAALTTKALLLVSSRSKARRITAHLHNEGGRLGRPWIRLGNPSRKSVKVVDWELICLEPTRFRWREIDGFRAGMTIRPCTLARFGDVDIDLGSGSSAFVLACSAGKGRLCLRLTLHGQRKVVDVRVMASAEGEDEFEIQKAAIEAGA